MDDDPEHTLDQVFLGDCESNDQVFNAGELQKFNLESNDDNSIHQESGDNGPFLEQEVTKKPVSSKDAPDPILQSDSQGNILRKKEKVDHSEPSDIADNNKNSTTASKKPSRRNIQRLSSQDSRRGSQQSVGQQLQVSQKSPRTQSISEIDTKDDTWVSKKTGKIMKCRSQQTSVIWERKVLSEIHCSSEEFDRSKGGSYSEEEITSGETPPPEEMSRSDTHQNSLQGMGSKQESHRRGLRFSTERSLLFTRETDSEEEIPWISPKTGKLMKNKTQQTSIIWELKTLSEILRCSSQDSFGFTYTGTTEDTFISSRDTEVGQSLTKVQKYSIQQPARGQESRCSSPQLEIKKSRHDIQQPEESKTKPSRNEEVNRYDQAQQTDSMESLKKELVDYKQQKNDSLVIDSYHSIHQADTQRSRGTQDSRKTTQELQGPVSKVRVEKEPKVLARVESEKNQKPFFTGEVDENAWISRKTGKIVKNKTQQTDRSWLQYCAAQRQRVKKCSSQQTDESFLQNYTESKRYLSSKARRSSGEYGPPGIKKTSSKCHDSDAPNLQFRDRDAQFLGDDATRGETAKESEPPAGKGSGGADRCINHSLSAEVQWPDESGSRSTVSASSLVEGEDAAQETYSIISLKDGILLNKKTGKILVSHSQQTNQTAVPTVVSAATLQMASFVLKEEGLQGPGRGKECISAEQRKAKKDGQQTPGKESRRSSQANQNYDAQDILEQPLGEDSRSTDDVEKLLSSRLSEAMLLSAESPDMEDEPQVVYSFLEEGSWMNVNTGRLLASQTQQTEEDPDLFLLKDYQPPGDTFWQDPEANRVKISGIDDDPASKA